jgi:hypothetical protein
MIIWTRPGRVVIVGWALLGSYVCAAQVGTDAMTASTVAGDGTRNWNFRVYLNQDPIGYHNFSVVTHGDAHDLKSVAHYLVKVLFINAYHYDHQATESWEGNCLHHLESSSDDDGTAYTVHGQGDEHAFDVDTTKGHYSVSGCAMTFAYWNPVMLQQTHLINPETGEDVAVTINHIGEDQVQVRHAPVQAQHYHLHSAKLEIDLWYSDQGDWLALESALEKGRRLRYVIE